MLAPPALGRLGPVIERAGRPDPAERYPDAATMGAALADAARAFPRAQPLVLPGLGPDGGGVVDPTQLGGASTALFDQDTPADAAEEAGPVPLHEERRPRSQRLVPLVVAFAVIAALVGGGLAFATGGGGTVAVPSVVGFNLDDTKIRVATDGLTVAVVERNADDPKGVVIAQRPAGGSFAGDSTRVRLVVSRGPPPVPIPDVRTLSPEDAQARLEEAGFLVTVERPNNETVPYNDVIDTDPPVGEKLPRDSEITLLVSNGPAPVQIPETANMSYDEAAQALTAKGFAVQRSDDFSDTVPVDKVIGTNPAVGTSQARVDGDDLGEQGPRARHGARPHRPHAGSRAAATRRPRARGRHRRLPPGPRGPQPVGCREPDGEEGHQGHVDLLSARRSVLTRDTGRCRSSSLVNG